jgi:hypothetical protein
MLYIYVCVQALYIEVIIIIIIIIGSTALCGPWPSSGASASLLYPSPPFRRRIVRPAFASSDFVTTFFFQGGVVRYIL